MKSLAQLRVAFELPRAPAPSRPRLTPLEAGTDKHQPARPAPAIRKPLSILTASQLGTAAAEIKARSALAANELGFFSQLLVQVTLPHRDPGDVIAWGRRNGRFTLTLQPGVQTDENGRHHSIGLPFGTYARLILLWISTEAVRTGSKHLDLGDSLSSFMRKLRLQRTGGAKGTELALDRQLRRLVHASLSWSMQSWDGREGPLDVGHGVFPIESRQLAWDPAKPEARSTWSSSLTLNQLFFEHLVRYHVPVDLRVVRELARLHSSLGIDIYTWLTHRVHQLKRQTPLISWRNLMEQMGTGHSNPKDFAREFKKELLKVRVLYPDARVEIRRGGLVLYPSATHIPRLSPGAPEQKQQLEQQGP